MKVIQQDPNGDFNFTDSGIQYFQDGCYPENKLVPEIRFLFIKELGALTLFSRNPEDIFKETAQVISFLSSRAPQEINLNMVREALREGGANFYNPEMGRTVSGIDQIEIMKTGRLKFPLFLLIDEYNLSTRKEDKDNLTIRAFSPIVKGRDYRLEQITRGSDS